MATRRTTHGPWRAAQISIRGHKVWAVRNSHRDPVAVVYTGQADAEIMAASLRMLGSLKHMVAIVRLFEPQLRASARAKYEAAQKLVNELEHSA